MNISEIFIRRPVATTLLVLGLFIFGIVGYHKLPISDLPDVDFPTIAVTATLPGASAETMASSMATPLERQFSTIAGITTMSSTSTLGNVQIVLQFDLDRNIDGAAQDVQSAITAAARQLPANLPYPPTFRKVNPADMPILYLDLTSKTLPLSTVDRYGETLLAQQISMVSGVAQVNVFGSQKYAVRIQLDPNVLNARSVGIDQVVQAVQNGNVNLPTGNLDGPKQSFLIQANGQLENAAAFRPLIVVYNKGAMLRLRDLGDVIDSVENNKVASWYNGTRGVVLAIQRQPGTNTIAVVDGIKKILPSFESQLPKDLQLNIIYDRSQSIRASVNDVQLTLIIAGILVVVVIFLFLRNLSATIIPSITLPLSIIGTFFLMHQFKFNLDNLSLLALTLSVGYVVDDAIVMLENIFRYRERGESPIAAALKGSAQISFTIISITLSLVAVFIPVLFMGGLFGRLLHEFAVTICCAILISGAISLTLTPMMASRFIRGNIEETHKPWQKKLENIYQKLLSGYERSLQWILQHRTFTIMLFLLTIIISGFLLIIIPKGFLPSEDTGQLFAYTEADPSVSFAAMVERQQQLADIVQQDPNVEGAMSSVGVGGPTATANAGRIFIRLKPRAQRPLAADEIVQELRLKLAKVPGITAYLQNIPSISIGRTSKSSYQYTLEDGNTTELYHWATIFTDELAKIPGFQDVTNDLQYTGPQVQVQIQRDKAAALGISAAQIENSLANAYGSQQISTIFTQEDAYQVLIELKPQYQANPTDLSKLYLRSSNGTLVPLTAVANLTKGVGLLTVNHQGQLPSVTISFNLKPDISLSQAVNAIQKIKNKLQPPSSLFADFQGTAQTFQSSLQGLGLLLIAAILVIYIVLGVLYESFIHPLTILSGLPAASMGALLTLLIFNSQLNLYSFIGIIMLIGIVKKNAIMMIDFALDAQRKDQKTAFDAIYQACIVRFRPIMMTTLAAIMGVMPIAIAFGAGAESRRPLGLAVMGGLLVSQLLTLYFTPVLFLYFESLRKNKSNNIG